MRKEFDIESWVVFVESVKTFVSFHHELIFKLLKKISILAKPIKIKVKFGKYNKLIDYTTRVKQGNNLAPVLFKIVMQF